MCENKIKLTLIGSGLIPVTELREYFIVRLGNKEILFEEDVLETDVVFALENIDDQSSQRKLACALSCNILILDEKQINSLLK